MSEHSISVKTQSRVFSAHLTQMQATLYYCLPPLLKTLVQDDGTKKAELNHDSSAALACAHMLELSCSSSSKEAACFNLMTEELLLRVEREV